MRPRILASVLAFLILGSLLPSGSSVPSAEEGERKNGEPRSHDDHAVAKQYKAEPAKEKLPNVHCPLMRIEGLGLGCKVNGHWSLYGTDGASLGAVHETIDGGGLAANPEDYEWGPEDQVPVHCMPDGSMYQDYYNVLVYAYADGDVDRYDSFVEPFRQAARQASWKIDEAAQLTGDHATLNVLCTDGAPTVLKVQVPAYPDQLNPSTPWDFGSLVQWFRNNGYGEKERHYVISFDQCFPGNCLGVAAGADPEDASLAETNTNNGHDDYAHYAVLLNDKPLDDDYLVSPNVFLHEWSHTSGAVLGGAPTATPGGHCWDGFDIVCYDDSSDEHPECVTPPNPTLCAQNDPPLEPGDLHNPYSEGPDGCGSDDPGDLHRLYDCHQDTYFNMDPPASACAGSDNIWISCNWNLGRRFHHYIHFETVEVPELPCIGSHLTFKSIGASGTQRWTFTHEPTNTETHVPGNGAWEPASTVHDDLWWAIAGPLHVRLEVDDGTGNIVDYTETVQLQQCPQTWATGDTDGLNLLVTGNDPGCGMATDEDDSDVAWPTDVSVAYDLSTGDVVGFEPPAEGKFLAGGPTLAASLLVAGGALDCRFIPEASTKVLDLPTRTWGAASPLNIARVAPASATVTQYYASGDVQTQYAIVAGGDRQGGNPQNPNNKHAPTPTLEYMNDVQGIWHLVEQHMPAGVVGASAAAQYIPVSPVPGDYHDAIVVTGGYSAPQTTTRFVQTFNVETQTWVGNHLPQERTDFGLASCGNTQRIVVGGLIGDEVPMYTFMSGGASNEILRYAGGTWTSMPPSVLGTTPHLPEPTAFHQVASDGTRFFVHGGFTDGSIPFASPQFYWYSCPGQIASVTSPCAENIVSFNPPLSTVYGLLCREKVAPVAVADGAMEIAPCLEPSMVAGLQSASNAPGGSVCALLMVFGGTGTATNLGGGKHQPNCPTDHVYVLDPVTGNGVDLTVATNGIVKLPIPLAGMGSARLDDGRIVLIGGRTYLGTSCQNSASDGGYKPSERTIIFDPTKLIGATINLNNPAAALNPFSFGPNLPVPVIAPAVGSVGSKVYVTGGDDRGDAEPIHETAKEPQRRHPVAASAIVDFAANAVSPWEDAPLAVVHGRLSVVDRVVWIIGGNQHPLAAVRAVQESQLPAGSSVPGWTQPVLPLAVAHHDVENCSWTGSQGLVGGVMKGTLYYTGLDADMNTQSLSGSVGTWGTYGTWALNAGTSALAFTVGYSGFPSDTRTGSTESSQRTAASVPAC